jgi:hypothetical protein
MVGETPDVIIQGGKTITKPVPKPIKITKPKAKSVEKVKPVEKTKKVNYASWYKKLTKISTEATNIIENVKDACPTIEKDLKEGYEPQIRVFVLDKNGKKIKTKTGFSTKVENLYLLEDDGSVDSFNFPTITIQNGKIKSLHNYPRPSRSGLRMIFSKVKGKYIPILSDNYEDYKTFLDGVSQYNKELSKANLPSKFLSLYGEAIIKKEKVKKRPAAQIKNDPYMPKSAI